MNDFRRFRWLNKIPKLKSPFLVFTRKTRGRGSFCNKKNFVKNNRSDNAIMSN